MTHFLETIFSARCSPLSVRYEYTCYNRTAASLRNDMPTKDYAWYTRSLCGDVLGFAWRFACRFAWRFTFQVLLAWRGFALLRFASLCLSSFVLFCLASLACLVSRVSLVLLALSAPRTSSTGYDADPDPAAAAKEAAAAAAASASTCLFREIAGLVILPSTTNA